MRILHVTPHLPPDQAANALLPWQLGNWARDEGADIEYVAHPPRGGGHAPLAGPVGWLPRSRGGALARALKISSTLAAYRIRRTLVPRIAQADVIHVHSNGLLAELAVLLARQMGKPVVLTLYGTEIWHYAPKKMGPDLFTRAYHAASYVTFYSDRLMVRAQELGLARRRIKTIYPPVADTFTWHDEDAQRQARASLGIQSAHLLLNVKRLHPLAGQRYLIEAMNEIIRLHPDTRLVICGTGALLDELKSVTRSAGVERHVTFAGMIDNSAIARYCAAADLFVLPSLLEALPTVAVEALACGTPVLSSDNPGGLELSDVFGTDVAIVPREQPMALASAIGDFLRTKRRTLRATRSVIDREFRPKAVASQYWQVYTEAQEQP
ncbi:MAG TPA: glycosyltransferase family 4 protein [Vicinamibacterales bacterium]|jgi:glycosyltransferase involved in cell wall biosynthesis|nr:glycosyltransferase family 4 protein [Vicinamibacterales bacterium]